MPPEILKRNNVRLFGRGERAMMFAHGFGCDQNVWQSVAPAFAEDHTVVLFDYVGSGNSDLSAYSRERYSDLYGYARDVLDICETLHLREVVFVGHSVSCMIGVLASLAAPETFEQLILIGPSPRHLNDPPDYVGGFERADIDALLDTMDRNFIGWATGFASMVMGNAERPELGKALKDKFCSTDPVIARQFAKAAFLCDHRADLAAVTVPSLILQCADDVVAPVAVGEYTHREIRQSELALLQATGHCPHMSHPDEVVRVMRRYLAARPADDSSAAA
jgi:sigma-B regulation protein RsbQ